MVTAVSRFKSVTPKINCRSHLIELTCHDFTSDDRVNSSNSADRLRLQVVRNKHKWKYYSSVAKLMNCWRDRASSFFAAYVTLWGAEAAVRAAKKVPAKCIAGRWGSMMHSERDLGPGFQIHVIFVFIGES